jgi:hypothetical protein
MIKLNCNSLKSIKKAEKPVLHFGDSQYNLHTFSLYYESLDRGNGTASSKTSARVHNGHCTLEHFTKFRGTISHKLLMNNKYMVDFQSLIL